MGTFLTDRDAYQALIIPQSRWVSWSAESTASPDGGRFDISSSSSLTLAPVVLGTGAPADDLTLTCARSGQPAPSDSNAPAGFTVLNQTSSAVYGLDECYHLTGVSTSIQAAATSYNEVALCTTSDERLVIAATNQTTNVVQVWYQDNDDNKPQTPISGPTVTASGTTNLTAFAYGDGLARVLFTDVKAAAAGVTFQIGCLTLDGTTVTTDSVSAVDDMVYEAGASSTAGSILAIKNIAAAARGDEVLLVVSVNYASGSTYRTNARSTLRQYASTDGGVSFRFIGELPDTSIRDSAVRPQVVATDAGFLVVYVGWNGSITGIYAKSIGSAYSPLRSATTIHATNLTSIPSVAAGSVSSNILTVEDRLAVWQDHRGHIFAACDESMLIRSVDGGNVWAYVGTWANQNGTDRVLSWSAAFHRGHAVIALDRTSQGISTDKTISLLSLGGFTNGTWPEDPNGAPDIERPKFSLVYVPAGGVQRLTDVSVSATSISQTLTLGVNRFTSGASFGVATITIDIDAGTGTDASDEPAAFEVSGSTSASATTLGLAQAEYPLTYELDVTDGVGVWYGLRVTHQSGELKLFERTGVGALTLRQTISLTHDRVDVRILIQDGVGAVRYREQNTATEGFGTPGVRVWKAATASALTLTNAWGAGAPTSSRARIITRMDTGDTADLHYFGVRGEENTDYNLTPMIAGTNTPRPAEYSFRPLFIAPDVVVRALGGSISKGETHTITAAYDFGLDQMTNTDPRRGFKETTTASGSVVLAWRTEDEVALRQPGGVIAITLVGSNISSVVPSIYDGSWDDFATTDVSVGGFGLHWTRQGKTIVANDAGSTGLLVRESEFNGATWSTGLDGAVITQTVGGQWDDGTYAPQLRLEETHTGSSGTGGAIIPQTVVILLYVGANPVEGVRLTISATNRASAGGPLKVDQAIIGRLLPHWQPQSWGRVVALEMGATTTELRDRSSRRVVDAQPRRVVDVAWADGIDTRQASEDTDEPALVDVFQQSTTAQAAKGATAWEVYGTLQRLNGDQPVVYLPRVPSVSGQTVQVLNRRDLVVYGRLEGDARMETVVGEEYTGEVLRGLGFTIRELI